MQNKTKGLIAGVAGIALLTGGSTFALWSSSATMSGDSILNGDLAVTAGPGVWQDVSADRNDKPHTITPATFKMVPGDTVTYTQPFDVTLVGDNLAATVTLKSSGAVPTTPSNVSVAYKVQYWNGTQWVDLDAATLDTPVGVRLFSADHTNKPSGAVVIDNSTATKDLQVVATVTYADVANQGGQNLTTTLPGLSVTIDQVRDAGQTPTPTP
ncbi:conserved hypothetical protein [Cellulomonas flavigena DSM 20109]|uniref:Alternate signal-mediated exported protein, RER_14450 family n=1 Tax=Cellulomonas flavigena (strain ATCC 482 / DSM 20109 / BCRC 11376 / JCM 18109 / NBRC 3775 / NCIMB 8073 / NRS 134) TaxID=446466 RepID=D5UIV9_CELFN|nr:alternate-type signal peptide domain-containing protein [Cellulomonas flavigena]ADG75525.1 conserved hypothetical protein [Cellulomonas flavigena DSM 20109]